MTDLMCFSLDRVQTMGYRQAMLSKHYDGDWDAETARIHRVSDQVIM